MQLNGAKEVFEAPVASKALAPFFAGLEQWRAQRDTHRKQYEEAKQHAAAHEETLRQITLLETRQKEINEQTDEKTEQLGRLGSPEAQFINTRKEWLEVFAKRADLLQEQCAKLTATPNTRLRATLRKSADVLPAVEALKQMQRGTKIRADKTDGLLEAVATATSPLEAWHGVLDELRELAWLKVEEEAGVVLPPTPRLDAAGYSGKDKIALARQFEPAAWLELMLIDIKDLPVFEYRIREGDFIPFNEASPGQQATALLSILLLQEGPPLIIDQPEDDLNMKVISEVVETLWQAKGHRQLVFASHNANLVVNGDAELVVCCDYRTSSTESGGKVKLTGAIDDPTIREEITEVMEGGEDAFKLRQLKYGF